MEDWLSLLIPNREMVKLAPGHLISVLKSIEPGDWSDSLPAGVVSFFLNYNSSKAK